MAWKQGLCGCKQGEVTPGPNATPGLRYPSAEQKRPRSFPGFPSGKLGRTGRRSRSSRHSPGTPGLAAAGGAGGAASRFSAGAREGGGPARASVSHVQLQGGDEAFVLFRKRVQPAWKHPGPAGGRKEKLWKGQESQPNKSSDLRVLSSPGSGAGVQTLTSPLRSCVNSRSLSLSAKWADDSATHRAEVKTSGFYKITSSFRCPGAVCTASLLLCPRASPRLSVLHLSRPHPCLKLLVVSFLIFIWGCGAPHASCEGLFSWLGHWERMWPRLKVGAFRAERRRVVGWCRSASS